MDPLKLINARQIENSRARRISSKRTGGGGVGICLKVALGVIALAAGALRGNASALDNWQWRNPLPQGNTLAGTAYGNGSYVAVGEAGTIIASVDGINWAVENTGTQSLTGVAYANAEFIATGTNGALLTSTDAMTWTPENSGTAATLYGATYGGGTNGPVYVVVGAGGTILSSQDSINWRAENSTVSVNLYSVTYGEGIFIAVGDSGTILFSEDGVTWETQTSPTGNSLTSVAFGLADFIAVGPSGDVVSSSDGVNWDEDGPIGTDLSCITFADSSFVALGPGNLVVTSTDGVGFNSGTTGPPGLPSAVCYGSGGFVTVGTDTNDTYGTIANSPDGNFWQSVNTAQTYQNLNGVAYTGKTFVGVGEGGTIVTSTNGVTWGAANSGVSAALNGVASGKGNTVAVGNNTIISSLDTVNWSADTLPVTTTFNGVAFGGNTFVSVGGGGTILSSPDGDVWTQQTSQTTSTLAAVAYGSGMFVAVGGGGALLTSPDGVNWTAGTSGTALDLTGVAYQNGIFAATGVNGTILYSTNGTTWSPATSGVTGNLNGIAGGDGCFVAAGAGGTLLSSTDGIVWTPRDPDLAIPQQLNGIGYGYGLFVAVGSTGTILGSQALPGVGPIVTTGTATGITTSSATLNGLVDPNGAGTTAYFAYSTNAQLVGAINTTGTSIAVGAGAVSVTGTAAGLEPGTTYYYQAVGVNANAAEGGQILSFETLPVAPVITSANVASGTNGEPFSYQITANYNPTSYGAANLPPGLMVSSSTGLISGTPTQFGNFPVTLSAINMGGTGTETLDVKVLEPALPVVNSVLNANGTVSVPFMYQISASNGPTSYNALGLPPGLTVSPSTGLISGTPTQAGQTDVTISGSNARGAGSATLVVDIIPLPPVITSGTTPTATEGRAFFYQITATNYPSSFGATGLPTGLNFDPGSGEIAGTPTESGTFPLTVSATNAGGTGTATVILAVVVPPPPVITSATSVTGTDGVQFQYQIDATNYPTSYSAIGLPSGLIYNQSLGSISGIPTQSGTFNATITASNAGGPGTSPLQVVVLPPLPVITSPGIVTGSNGTPFSYQILATNGASVYGATGLPSGLTVNAASGLISGTPAGAGLVAATVSAANSSGTTYKSLDVELSVNPAQTAGSYDGLAAVDGTDKGMLTLTLSAKGGFTGKLSVAGETYPVSGTATAYGFLRSYTEEDGSTVVLSMQANPFVPSVSGTVNVTTNGSPVNYAVIMSLRGVFKAGALPDSLVGRYTVVLPGISGTDARTPHAPGYGTLTVSSKGAISLKGKLGDGTPLTVATQLHADKATWTLFKTLYAGKRPGTVAGEITFESRTDSDADGSIEWLKPLQLKPGYYPGGFEENVNLYAAAYTAPPLSAASGTITIEGGNLTTAETISNPLAIIPPSKITATGTNDVTVSVTASTGAFSGSFKFPVTDKKTSFGGVMYEKPLPAGGFGLYLGTDQAGPVYIEQQ